MEFLDRISDFYNLSNLGSGVKKSRKRGKNSDPLFFEKKSCIPSPKYFGQRKNFPKIPDKNKHDIIIFIFRKLFHLIPPPPTCIPRDVRVAKTATKGQKKICSINIYPTLHFALFLISSRLGFPNLASVITNSQATESHTIYHICFDLEKEQRDRKKENKKNHSTKDFFILHTNTNNTTLNCMSGV